MKAIIYHAPSIAAAAGKPITMHRVHYIGGTLVPESKRAEVRRNARTTALRDMAQLRTPTCTV